MCLTATEILMQLDIDALQAELMDERQKLFVAEDNYATLKEKMMQIVKILEAREAALEQELAIYRKADGSDP